MIHSTKKNHQYWLFWCQWWSDHQDQEVFFGEGGLRLQRPLRSMRLERFLRPRKSLLWTSEPSRFLNSKILGLISLYFDVLRKNKFEQNHENSCWILELFLSEAVEAAWTRDTFHQSIVHVSHHNEGDNLNLGKGKLVRGTDI